MTETAKQEKVNQESKQEQRYYYTVMEEQEGMRLDQFLAAELKEHSRSYIQKLLKDGKISVNQSSVKPNYKISENDKIEVFIPDPEVLDILPENIPLDILYEVSDILIVIKPKNMVVHPAPGHYEHTLVNALK